MLSVATRIVDDVLLEHYQYASGPPQQTGRHAHAEYQVCLSWNVDGEYWYRGAYRSVPARSISILHPGEVHSSRDLATRVISSEFSLFYLPIPFVKEALTAGRHPGRDLEPYFKDAISINRDTFHAFAQVDAAWRNSESLLLQRQAILYHAISQLLVSQCHLENFGEDPPGGARPAVRQARDYICANYLSEISFAELREVSGLSAFHLARCFHREVGLPPHKYQMQLRIGHAQKLIAKGYSLSQVASVAGFSDQSHLGRHFKRLVKLSPGRYWKNLSYRESPPLSTWDLRH